MAYLLLIACLIFARRVFKAKGSASLKRATYMLVSLLIIQFLLGIFTIINCIGHIPLTLAVLHQGVALWLFAASLYVYYQFLPKKVST